MLRAFVISAAVAVLCSPASSAAVGGPIIPSTCADEAEAENVQVMQANMMQQRSRLYPVEETRAGKAPPPTGGVEDADAITWFHPPRTGSSLAFTLVLSPRLCQWTVKGLSQFELPAIPAGAVSDHCPRLSVPDSCARDENYVLCAEFGIGDMVYQQVEGKLAGMFRDPLVRVLSDWSHTCELNPSCETTPASYAVQYEGCVTMMLTRDGNLIHCEVGDRPTFEEAALAKERVSTGFSFIGMTDDWDLSMCLFNAMFSNPCNARQFLADSGHIGNAYNVSELDGWVDRFDTGVWEVAQDIFQSNLLKYGVSAEECAPCYELTDDAHQDAGEASP